MVISHPQVKFLIWFRVGLTIGVAVANKRVSADMLRREHFELYNLPRSSKLFSDKVKPDKLHDRFHLTPSSNRAHSDDVPVLVKNVPDEITGILMGRKACAEHGREPVRGLFHGRIVQLLNGSR